MRIALRIYLNVGLESIKKIGVFHLYFECKVAGANNVRTAVSMTMRRSKTSDQCSI